MEDFTTKVINGALNFAFLTRESAEKIFTELVKTGKVSKDEGQKIFSEFMSKFESESSNLSQKLKDEIKKIVEEFGFVNRREFDELKERLRKVEAYVNEVSRKAKKH